MDTVSDLTVIITGGNGEAPVELSKYKLVSALHDEPFRERNMTSVKATLILGAVAGLSLMNSGCLATRKHVRNQIAPVQAQVNTVQKQTADNKQAIGDLDRNLATTDEKATQAGRDAKAAAEAAARANDAATSAGQRADNARQLAEQTGTRLDSTINNLDNYRLVDTQKVYFRFGKSELTDEGKQQLDQAISQLGNVKSYVIEIEGFTDRTGGKAYNLGLSQRRADAVERYLTLHNVPLRKVHVVGIGSEDPNADMKTRAGRKEERRVDVRVYALDINGQGANTPMSSSTGQPMNGNGAADRMSNTMPSGTATGNMPASTSNTTTPDNNNMPASTNNNGATGTNPNMPASTAPSGNPAPTTQP